MYSGSDLQWNAGLWRVACGVWRVAWFVWCMWCKEVAIRLIKRQRTTHTNTPTHLLAFVCLDLQQRQQLLPRTKSNPSTRAHPPIHPLIYATTQHPPPVHALTRLLWCLDLRNRCWRCCRALEHLPWLHDTGCLSGERDTKRGSEGERERASELECETAARRGREA